VEILVDNQKIEYTLENETKVGEIVTALEAWLSQRNLGISGIALDDTPFSYSSPDDWEERAIGDTRVLNLKTCSRIELRQRSLETLGEYFIALRAALEIADPKAADRKEIQRLADDYSYVAEFIPVVLPDISSSRDDPLGLKGLLVSAVSGDTESVNTVRSISDRILTVISDRLREIQFPEQELQAVCRVLSSMIADLSEISVLLQTGKDKEAMETVIRFTEITSKLVRILMLVPAPEQSESEQGNRSIENLSSELNTFLEEMITAFTTGDSVLIGDLMEYEIVPRIEELLHYLVPEQSGNDAR
jgi:hypothetical protein